MWKMLPRKGFTNNFRCEYDNVLLSEIDAFIRAGKLDPTRVITVKHMYDAGLLEKKAYNRDGVQVLSCFALLPLSHNFHITAYHSIFGRRLHAAR